MTKKSCITTHRKPHITHLFSLATKIIFTAFLTLAFSMFIPPLRNAFLYPVWPKPWRTVGTFDLLIMETMTQGPDDVQALLKCTEIFTPTKLKNHQQFKRFSVDPQKISAPDLSTPEHEYFLPVLNAEDKTRLLMTYLVLAEVLHGSGVQFFLRAGSLIGAHRHHGIVPWDDDMDVAIDVRDWNIVRELLSCVEGYVLQVNPNMHWVFRTNSSTYPFIDIFFYTGNKQYIWAITQYTRRTMVLERSLVFPLTSGQFEGIEVPIPQEADKILRKLYDFDYCVSRSSDHKTGVSFPKIISVHCSSLSYMYNIFNVKGG